MENKTTAGWRRSLAAYTDRRVLMVLVLGFASGLPYLLTVTTLSAWLATAGIRRAAIGIFALAGTPYALKFLWAPLIDRLPPPLPLGRRRGWGITIQFALIAAILALATCDPKRNLMTMGALTLLVGFLAASQDIVIDAWRVEVLPIDLQGPGAGAYTVAYRFAMLVSGAVALVIAEHFGWFAAYSTMARAALRRRAGFPVWPGTKSRIPSRSSAPKARSPGSVGFLERSSDLSPISCAGRFGP